MPTVSANVPYFFFGNLSWDIYIYMFQNQTGVVGLLQSMRTQDVGNAYLAYLCGTLGMEYGHS